MHSVPVPIKNKILLHTLTQITNQIEVLLTASENVIIIILHFPVYVQISANFTKFYLRNQTLSALIARITTSCS